MELQTYLADFDLDALRDKNLPYFLVENLATLSIVCAVALCPAVSVRPSICLSMCHKSEFY